MINFGVILSAMYLLTQYIQNGLLLPVALTGIIMLPGGIVNALVSGLAGRLFDNYGAKMLTTLGFLIATVGAVMLACVTPHSAVWYVIAAHVILMAGCPLAMSPAQTHALNALQLFESADGSTIINTLQQVVGAIATALATSFLGLRTAAYPGTNHAAAFTNGVHFEMAFTVVLTVVGVLIALSLKKEPESHDVTLTDE